MKAFSRRAALLAGGAAVGGWAVSRFGADTPVLEGTTSLQPAGGGGVLNDASGLSETPIHKHITLQQDRGEALIAALRRELAEARAEGRPVSLSAARHTMGGQAIPRDGVAITQDSAFLEADSTAQTFRCAPGLRWSQAIAALDPLGFSPKVMQSNNDFGVASTFCVNAHGWPVPWSGMGSTVRSIDLMLADGEVVTCSRDRNTDLFNQSMGGYGLTGLITSLEVEMVPNLRLTPDFTNLKAEDFGPAMMQAVADPNVNMAYGRLNVDRDGFFDDALLIAYRPSADQSDLPPASGSGFVSKVSRHLFRAQLGNERVKRARWWVETKAQRKLAAGEATRNSLINEPVVTLDDRDPARTDILHEYFIAPDRFADWVALCRRVIPATYQELLNITLRYVAPDRESWLSYAPGDRIACVMLFSQEMTARGEADMARMTRALIDGTAELGGAYYLPYRLHATQEQFQRVYPRARAFAAAKRAVDPDGVFGNALWDTYMRSL